MINIKEIVGQKSYARLVKAGRADPKKLSKLPEAELMQVMRLAGIGPKKTKKLMQALNRPISEKKINKTYRNLNLRTRFKNVSSGIKNIVKDPTPTIQKIESIREALMTTNRLLTSLRNIDKPESEKEKLEAYAPVPLLISPSMIGETRSKLRQIGEMRVNQEIGQISIELSYINPYDYRDVKTVIDTIKATVMTPDVQEKVLRLIKQNYNDFKRDSPGSRLTIILSTDLKLEPIIRQTYPQEISEGTLMVVTGEKQYAVWEKLFKYLNNQLFLKMIDELDNYRKMYHYLNYKEEHPNTKITFTKYIEKLPKGEEFKQFFEKATELGRAIIKIKHPTDNVWFGIIEAYPDKDLFQYGITYKQLQISGAQTYQLPKTPEALIKLQKEPPLGFIEGKDVSQEIMGLINKILEGKYNVYAKTAEDPLIFSSAKLPDIGFVID